MLTCQVILTQCFREGNSLAQVLRRFHELEDSGQKCSALSYAAAERQNSQLSATAAYQSVREFSLSKDWAAPQGSPYIKQGGAEVRLLRVYAKLGQMTYTRDWTVHWQELTWGLRTHR